MSSPARRRPKPTPGNGSSKCYCSRMNSSSLIELTPVFAYLSPLEKERPSGDSTQNRLSVIGVLALPVAFEGQRNPHRFQRRAGQGGGRQADATSQGPGLFRQFRDARPGLRRGATVKHVFGFARHQLPATGDFGRRGEFGSGAVVLSRLREGRVRNCGGF